MTRKLVSKKDLKIVYGRRAKLTVGFSITAENLDNARR